mgnify:FL=1
MRKLIYIPIIHTMVDMGSQAETLKKEYLKRYGRQGWSRSRQAINHVWTGIRKRVLALELDFTKVRIYQDGLPVGGRELEIAREVAARGSKNHELLIELLQRGAKLEGTESPDLLLKEHKLIKDITQAKDEAERQAARETHTRESARILRQRDEFISQRINDTLKDGEVGILFMGLMHRVDKLLPKDIEVSYLIYRLPFGERGEGERMREDI